MVAETCLTKPTLIMVIGSNGIGKSVFAKRIVRSVTNSVYIEKDLINQAFLWSSRDGELTDITRYLPPQELIGRNTPYYRNHILFQSYHCMLMMAKQSLLLDKHPVLDCTYLRELRWGYLETVLIPQLTGVKYALKIILLYASSPEIVRARIAQRGAQRDACLIDDEQWKRLLEEQSLIPTEIEKHDHIKLDNSDFASADANLAAALAYLRS
ncbi:MAG: hypothetical protein UY02_C0056G0005 [Candidatus Giovannonibacteria bacterium GW2011_GWB1_47_6b]|uniref:Dephospho-CoA kinase-like protein n=1 Tax=Candidatus Giovannonibacteria bacterium GW2011_GWB1_47_6b TaxID=1618655 RepID=A0A0G1VAR8_9BACT|nr:MAG: hypothetical protein UY02_C0056G0005 [Candidatus Giovannonibacteria bacterium GW2011_GWB1_47_6b]